MNTYYGPELNDGRHVFVFGSNKLGIHGAGSAKTATSHWGAIEGIGSGRSGNSYALVTRLSPQRSVDIAQLRREIRKFLKYAHDHPELVFLMTAVGCGMAGFAPAIVAPMFVAMALPANVILPIEWSSVIPPVYHAGVKFFDNYRSELINDKNDCMGNRLRDKIKDESEWRGRETPN